jgi:redox-sensitive bicupin YhaK (pirin superfamily)
MSSSGVASAELASEGTTVALRAGEHPIVLLAIAESIRAPVVAHGPFVINTRQELVEAIRDRRAEPFASGLG